MAAKTIVDFSDVGVNMILGTRIILDGVDISNDCYRAEVYDDGTGTAFCWKLRDGKHVLNEANGHPEKEDFAGKVEIVRP